MQKVGNFHNDSQQSIKFLSLKTHCFAAVSNPSDLETQDQLHLHVIHDNKISQLDSLDENTRRGLHFKKGTTRWAHCSAAGRLLGLKES